MPFDQKLAELEALFEYNNVSFDPQDYSSTFETHDSYGQSIKVTISSVVPYVEARIYQNDVEISVHSSECIRHVQIIKNSNEVRFDIGTKTFHGYVHVGLRPRIFARSLILTGENSDPIAA